ncbi:MAG: PAS domain S-box protein [Methanoregula sp.]|jgi:PAS domain S-box-containing protein
MTRILIADDNPQNLYLLESILKGHQFEVILARNGAEALDAALKNPPDLIIADILMPVMDGFELCRKWKAEERLTTIPFIFYTATYTDPKDEQFALSLGAERFMVKPQKPEVLVQAVREVLEKARHTTPGSPVKSQGEEMEELRLYNAVLFHKLEKKMRELEGEISERKRVEEEMRFKNVILSTQQETALDGILIVDENGNILSYNQKFIEMWGVPDTLLVSRIDEPLLQHVGEQLVDPDAFLLRVRHLYDHKDEKSFEEIFAKDGRVLERFSAPMLGESGKYYGRVWYFRDITGRKQAERKLRQSGTRYRKLYESMMDAFVRVDMAGRIQECNHSFKDLLGYSDTELAALTYLDLTPEKWQAFENFVIETQTLPRGYSDVYEKEYRKKDGTIVPVEVRTSLIRDTTGQAEGMWAIVRDITDRKRAEEKIHLANRKLALMTDVTYQDIQNKVTGLRAYAGFLKDAVTEQDRLALIKKEEAVLGAIHNLIKNTKDYQQMGIDQSQWVPLQQTIRAQLALMSQKDAVVLDSDLRGLEIYSDPLINRVFYNLIHNAIYHGKKITRISFSCQETPDGMVLICEDDGVGIPSEQKPHIFDRVVGGGGKFGLFFVREFLTLSGMTIAENGEPGKGARFEIMVPKGAYRFVSPVIP